MNPPEAATGAAEKIAESKWFVLFAYVLAFGIWTAAAGNDFVSSTWKTVRHTRRRGKLHVALSFVPMIYISVYIFYQHNNEDYQEVGAALLALAFAVLHLGRTFMGLWQLHMYKMWTISSIKSMESLGFKTRSPDINPDGVEDSDSDDGESGSEDESGNDEEEERVEYGEGYITENSSEEGDRGFVSRGETRGCWQLFTSLVQKSWSLPSLDRERDRIDRIADAILVNDTLIDNRLTDVHTVCYFRLLCKPEERAIKKAKSAFFRSFLRLRYGLRNALRGAVVLFSLAFLEAPVIPSSDSGPRIVPQRPESIWLNWATSLVAQVGWHLDDYFHADQSPLAKYEERRSHFAEQILLSAALHAGRATKSTNRGTSPPPALLSYLDWHKYPKLCSGQFCKQEFLKRACKSGNGLPYHMPHLKAVEGKGKSKRFGYSNFASELHRAREALPPELETCMKRFDVKNLEWFAVFLSVENWAAWASSNTNSADRECYSRISSKRQLSDDKSGSGVKPDELETDELETENDIPMNNLKKQLGFLKHPNFLLERSKLPFVEGFSKSALWGNRNVLEISCHVDNWIALCAGEQASYMVKHVPWMGQKLSIYDLPSHTNDEDDKLRLEKIVHDSVDFEKHRFICQMAVIQPQHSHLEKSFSFLGCSMEMLRSSLAKWVQANEISAEGCWTPRIFGNGGTHEGRKRRNIGPFEGSPDFTSCLRSLLCVGDMSKRFAKMRILWELQNYFQEHLQKHGSEPDSIETMALCILSFPAISIEVRHAEQAFETLEVVQQGDEWAVHMENDDGKSFQVQNYEYVICACYGPQDLRLIVSFEALREKSKALISIRVDVTEDCCVTDFHWEVWKNAFYGRLEGVRQWKQTVGLPRISLIPSAQRITSGIEKMAMSALPIGPEICDRAEMLVWKGWLPHCASICLFEMTTDRVILQPRQTEGVSIPVKTSSDTAVRYRIPKDVLVPVKYAEANSASLKNASLVVQDLLVGALGPDHHLQAQTALERAEALLSQDSDANYSLALLLIEVAAIHERDTAALKKAVQLLLRRRHKAEAISRAAALVEQFYVYGIQSAETSGRSTLNLPSFFRNENDVEVVRSLFELLFQESEYGDSVREKYQLFLIFFDLYRSDGSRESAVHVMHRSIVHSCYSKSVAESANSNLKSWRSILRSYSFEEFAVMVLTYSNIANAADQERKRRSLNKQISVLEKARNMASIDLAVAIQHVAKKEGGINTLETLGMSPRLTVDLFEKSIQDSGSSNAMYHLGKLFEKGGPGIEQDIPRAIELLNRAIREGGNVHAMNELARLLSSGNYGVEKDLPCAFELFSRAINEGNHTGAMRNLAMLLSKKGEGVERNIPRAMELLNRAINQGGVISAMNDLACLLSWGKHGVEKDLPRAIELFSRAITEGNHTGAMRNLASLLSSEEEGVEKNIPRAVELLERVINEAINQGEVIYAMNDLACLLRRGEIGVEKDLPRAIELFSRAITEGNHTGAMRNLASLLSSEEEGVEKNIPRAVELLERAINEGASTKTKKQLAGLRRQMEMGSTGTVVSTNRGSQKKRI